VTFPSGRPRQQNGKEYLVIMAGGHHFMMTPPGDALIAYALPDTK
jgi:quinoprotein glucose dehydrogenase